jgi:hypothetical protein
MIRDPSFQSGIRLFERQIYGSAVLSVLLSATGIVWTRRSRPPV